MEPEDVTFQILQEITDDFSDARKIGEGAFGVVYKGVTKNGQDVAVKKLKFRDADLNDEQFRIELNNLRKLEHKNIVRILGYCYETKQKPSTMPDGTTVYLEEIHRALCFEYLDNGSLEKHLSDDFCGLDMYTQFKIIKGICEGLKYIHEELEAPIYHLDLKPDNILLDKDMVPKIADFGLSRIFGKELKRNTHNPYGTPGYQPPEYIDRGEISGKFDIFSLGVIMIRIVSGSKGYPKCLDMPLDEFIDQVRENWRNRLRAISISDSLLESYCDKVEICTKIALNCVESDSLKRPDIVKIIKKLKEIEIDTGKIVRRPTEIFQLPQEGCSQTVTGITVHKKKMRKESNDIIGGHQNINLMTDPNCSELEFVDARETSPDVGLIVGRSEEKGNIMATLLKGMSKEIIILPIYGIGGIGKTSFARLIYNDPKFKSYSHVWVNVTQRFDLSKICESIISQLPRKENQANERQMIPSCPMTILSGKKVLIILDDLWEDNQFQLQDLKAMLYRPDSNIIVLVTTRSELVAKRICTNHEPYKILPLTDDMCWDIIKQRSGFEDKDDKERLVGIGLEIAKKCGGVALAARSVGFTLRSMNCDEWMKVKDSDIWNGPISKDVSLPNHVLASLKLSYSYMDRCLQKCFAYCAIFPKGHDIDKNDLVYQWISLDFVKPTNLLSNMQLCDKYTVQLLGLSFLQRSMSPKTVGVYHEDVTVFTMHDLVHDLARMLMADEILDASKQGIDTGSSRYRFALLNDCSKSLESFTQYPSEIRALHLLECDKTALHGASSLFSKFLSFRIFGKIGRRDDIFSAAKHLRVLDLSKCSLQKLGHSIGNLKQLRYLSAPKVQDWMIPDCITELSELMYLSLCGSSEIVELRESFGAMECLMYLDLSGCCSMRKLPLSFGKLKELVHLDLSNCSQVTNISESLERLTNLEYLNLSYCTNIGDLPKHLGGLLKLRNLDLSYSSYIDGRPNVEDLVTLTKLECLNLASNLSFIENLPGALRRLTHLKYLNLSCVSRDTDRIGYDFQNLKNLPESNKGVRGMLEVLGTLTKLQYLNLSGFSCYVYAMVHLAEMSEGGRNLTQLRNLNGKCRKTFATLLKCISKLRNLEHLDLSHNVYLESVPDSFGSLLKLHTFNLSRCWELITLPEILYDMDSLKFLDLTGCGNLRIPEQGGLNKSLLTLPHFLVQGQDSSSNLVLLQDVNRTDLVISKLENVKSAQEARSINLTEKSRMKIMELKWTKGADRSVEDMGVLGELVPPTTLETLVIHGYNSVKFPEWFVDIAHHLPNLVRISLSNLPKCNSLPPLGQLPNLKVLVIEGMNGISEINWDLCGSRRAFHRLESFTLCKMESLKVWYTTNSAGMDDVSEFMFPKLSNLKISDCPSLRLEPCPHRVKYRWDIVGNSDGVISSCGEDNSSQISVSSFSVPVELLVVDHCMLPMHQWRLLHYIPALTKLSICECSDLSSSPEITRALSSLRSLQIEQLPNWLCQLASLNHLTVRCYEVKAPPDGFPHLPRLRSLRLDEFQSMTTLRHWVGSLISLQRLEISCCYHIKNLNDLAESFECLSSLKELYIMSCYSMVSLPESIGRLTSLNELHIESCDRITSLPESILQLTNKLKKLKIVHCMELEKWCRTEENKAKLAHIKEKTIVGWSF